MIKLYQFPGAFGMTSLSPYCAKAAAFFCFANIPYEEINLMSTSSAPKKQLPYIEFPDGKKLGDSQFIINHFQASADTNIDAHLTPSQKAEYLCIQALLEERLTRIMVYSRWFDTQGWAVIKPLFFHKVPGILRNFIAGKIRKHIRKMLYIQGIGRHSQHEIYQLSQQDLQSLVILLGDKLYFGGEKPCSLDASAYGVLANIHYIKLDTELNRQLERLPTLVAYCERIQQNYFAKR
ncbi:MAG: glutathione S-transferase family protein [Gammaproteobacteria bacterium]|nr:glutathione S-transferase family protein [Gammaproteobacteria bacterium]